MASEEVIAYYKSWLYEKARAGKFGKTNYGANCDIELSRLGAEYPELAASRADYEAEIDVDTIVT